MAKPCVRIFGKHPRATHLRVGVNLLLLQPETGGVSNYVLTLLRAWPDLFPDDPLVLFTFPVNDALLVTLPARSRVHEIRLSDQREILQHLDAFDVFFCPFGSLSPRPVPKPSLVTLVDIQERFFPDFFSAQDIANRLYHYDWSLRMADRAITISHFSKNTMVSVLGLPEEKIAVIHLCPDELPAEASRPDFPVGWDGPFAFFPANDWPHKNHERLLQALASLKQSGVRVRCVLTGNRGARFGEIIRVRDSSGLDKDVVHLGSVSRAEMAWLFRNARLLVLPSLFEGFGIPVTEAMASDLPVVCSRTTSLPEVAGPAALYFDPYDVEDMASKIRQVWTAEDVRSRLLAAGRERRLLFGPRQLVEEHAAAFRTAAESYRVGRHIWHTCVVGPWAAMHRRRRIPASQLAAAQRLLHRATTAT